MLFFCILLPFLCRLDSVFWLERDMKCVKFIDIIAFGERPANLSPCRTRMHGRDKFWFVVKVESCGPWVLRHLKISRPRHKTIMWHGIPWAFDFLETSQRLLRDARQWSALELAWIYCALHFTWPGSGSEPRFNSDLGARGDFQRQRSGLPCTAVMWAMLWRSKNGRYLKLWKGVISYITYKSITCFSQSPKEEYTERASFVASPALLKSHLTCQLLFIPQRSWARKYAKMTSRKYHLLDLREHVDLML